MKRPHIDFSNDSPAQLSIPFEEFQDKKPLRSAVPEKAAARSNEHQTDKDQRLIYLSLASGSSGNCCYLGSSKGGVLIDAGIRTDIIEDRLNENGLDIRHVRGLLLTHDHTDHVKYAYSLLRNNRHLKLFCTPRVLNAMLRRHSISKRIKEYHVPIFKEIPFSVGDFRITAFEVPHDACDSMGFSVEFDSRKFVLATDLGAVTERARHYMSQANYLVIEANYDLTMLIRGTYPEYLKARIRTERGHLDNTDTAAFLKEIAGGDLKYIFLCHLSKENNMPQIAVKCVREALLQAGLSVGDCSATLSTREADVQLMALPREEASPLFVFRPF
ncbi:MAG: MBL fold metallo-hydrolase [Muribaculaceae bacterium]|nr:MBL fold metallo-hydrolase [Muribaculaceae bacterium]